MCNGEVWSNDGKLFLVNCYNPCKSLILIEFEDIFFSRIGSSVI